MLLTEAVSALREDLHDGGIFLTHIGSTSVAAGTPYIPVADISQFQVGMFVLIGTPPQAESHIVVSLNTGSSQLNIDGTLTFAYPAYTPVGSVGFLDTTYISALKEAHMNYSQYRVLEKRYTLNIVSGTDTYTLPSDWLNPNRDSLDAAIGMTSVVSHSDSSYTMLYNLSLRDSTQGMGTTMGFGTNIFSGMFPIVGDPFNNPNGGSSDQAGDSAISLEYTFIRSGTPTLIVKPVPAFTSALDIFYYAYHTFSKTVANVTSYWTMDSISTLPADKQYEPLLYAKYLRAEALITDKAQFARLKMRDKEIDSSRALEAFRKMSDTARTEYNRLVVQRPIGVKG